ncbi:MAG TPA: nodulation protein NfeD [Gaiellaceae bacterium]|nr:nodulation protein NfeD [Gaiellaceae bacterium]
MKSRFLRGVFTALAVVAVVPAVAAAAPSQPRVLAVEFDNDVNPVTADYVIDQIERANEENYDAVVILLDTPGGLADAMKDIYEAELASKVPVIVYVSPEGARAASAGVWIGMAGDVLAMAPQTNIGSSTPVSVGGEDIQEDLRRKVVNDAAASLRGLAREHDRNVRWADEAVRKGSNLNAREALEQNVIDVIARDLPTLLNRIDGMETKPKMIVLDTANAKVDNVEMSLWKQILDTLINPNLIVILMSLGVLGITIELWSPGLIFPGTVGAISLIIGLFGLQILPVSWAGVLLMLLAAGFFVAEMFVVSHGALALAGAVAFVVGALMLFDPAGDAYQVSLEVALGIAATMALMVGLVVAKLVQVRRAEVVTGQEELVGQLGVVRQSIDPVGLVFVHGELWRATTEGGEPIPAGREVRVEGLDDALTLTVAPA